MNFTTAIKTGFSKYVTFSGRAQRSEFWFFALFVFLAAFIGSILDQVLFNSATGLFYAIAALATLLPYISVAVRRLHDIDKSGWWMWISLIPLVGAILLIVWYCTKGTAGPNRFGADPLA